MSIAIFTNEIIQYSAFIQPFQKVCSERNVALRVFLLQNIAVSYVNNEIVILYNGMPIKEIFDAIIIRSADTAYNNTHEALAKYIKCHNSLNSANAIRIANDKQLTSEYLVTNGYNIPKSCAMSSAEKLDQVLSSNDISFPLIIKTNYGLHGVGVLLANTIQSAKSIIDLLQKQKTPFCVQEFIEHTNADRVVLLDGQLLGAMRKSINTDDFRGNARSATPLKLIPRAEDLIKFKRISKDLDARFIAIDYTLVDDELYIFEINTSPGLEALQSVTDYCIYTRMIETLCHTENKPDTVADKINKLPADHLAKILKFIDSIPLDMDNDTIDNMTSEPLSKATIRNIKPIDQEIIAPEVDIPDEPEVSSMSGILSQLDHEAIFNFIDKADSVLGVKDLKIWPNTGLCGFTLDDSSYTLDFDHDIDEDSVLCNLDVLLDEVKHIIPFIIRNTEIPTYNISKHHINNVEM